MEEKGNLDVRKNSIKTREKQKEFGQERKEKATNKQTRKRRRKASERGASCKFCNIATQLPEFYWLRFELWAPSSLRVRDCTYRREGAIDRQTDRQIGRQIDRQIDGLVEK